MKKNQIPATIQALLAAALFGLSAPAAKTLLGSIPPISLAAFLYLGSGFGALFYLLFTRRPQATSSTEARLDRADWPWLAGALIFGGVAAPIVLMFSLQHTPAATASLLLNFEGIATTLIAAAVFREAIGRRVWGAIALISLASILLSWDPGAARGFSLSAMGILLACVFWGLDNNFTRNISAKNPLVIVMVKGFGAGFFSLALAFIFERTVPGLFVIGGAMVLGSLSYGASIMLFILSMRELGAARTSAFFGTAPFVGALFSFLLLQERPNLLFLAAMSVMVGGTVLLFWEKHSHHHRHQELFHDHRHSHDDGHHLHAHAHHSDGHHSHPHMHDEIEHHHHHTPDIHHRHPHTSI